MYRGAELTFASLGHLQVPGCVCYSELPAMAVPITNRTTNIDRSVQVNIPAESGEMGVLASHVPSIEQLRPGLVEVFEESGGSKQFFRTSTEYSKERREPEMQTWERRYVRISY